MKLFSTITLLIILLQGCENHNHFEEVNQFSSSNDTIVIRTKKIKGSGLFTFHAGFINFEDTFQLFQYPVIYPTDVLDIKGVKMIADFKSNGLDYIDVISGLKENKKVFIVDQNNNQNFTDDSIRFFQEMEWHSSLNSIKCDYNISNGHKIFSDSSWVKLGTQNGNIFYGRDEHLTADFRIDNNQYKIGIVDDMLSMAFTYGADPKIAILAENLNRKDSLILQDYIKSGEYLNLNENHYLFSSITNDGKNITLVKEANFSDKVGTQIGMIAPEFVCLSTEGDTIISFNLQNKPIIVANSCGCGGDTLSTEAFFNIENTFGDKLYALRLDSEIKSGLDGWNIETKEVYNKDIYNKYRQAYCSRTAYVIGIDKRIHDKFYITDWESFLPKHIHD